MSDLLWKICGIISAIIAAIITVATPLVRLYGRLTKLEARMNGVDSHLGEGKTEFDKLHDILTEQSKVLATVAGKLEILLAVCPKCLESQHDRFPDDNGSRIPSHDRPD